MGPAGTGRVGKLLNNALLMTNQKNIEDILNIASAMNVEIPELVAALGASTTTITERAIDGAKALPVMAVAISH